ncbi:MAG: hypothetical protein IJU79_05005 [Desulfovibrionaceae bacterium]|nr:hypothetical protein [Desulfovibrionaceae bacterium]
MKSLNPKYLLGIVALCVMASTPLKLEAKELAPGYDQCQEEATSTAAVRMYKDGRRILG